MVPPLAMIDDIISFASCGPKSVIINTIINSKIEMKKMELGAKKCHNIHVGPNSESCSK